MLTIASTIDKCEMKLREQLDRQMERLQVCYDRAQNLRAPAPLTDSEQLIQTLQAQLAERERVIHTLEQEQSTIKTTIAEKYESRLNEQIKRVSEVKDRHREELQWIASLWPDEEIVPSMIKPYFKDSQAERDEELKRLENEKKLRQEALVVRQKMKEAASWVQMQDEYEQVYYINTETSQSLWDEPEAMLYQPPTGWDVENDNWEDGYELNPVESALKIAKTDYDAIDEPSEIQDNDDDDDSDEQEEDGEEEEEGSEEDDEMYDPQALGVEMTDLVSQEKRMLEEMENIKTQQRTVAHKIVLGTKQMVEFENAKIQVEETEAQLEEQRKRDKIKNDLKAAREEAEAIVKYGETHPDMDQKMQNKVQKAQNYLNEHVDDEKEAADQLQTQTAHIAPIRRPTLVRPTCVIPELRYEMIDYQQMAQRAEAERIHKDIDTLEAELSEIHDEMRVQMEDTASEMNFRVDRMQVDIDKIAKKEISKRKFQTQLQIPIPEPREPVFSPIEDFNPFETTTSTQQVGVESEITVIQEDDSDTESDDDDDIKDWQKSRINTTVYHAVEESTEAPDEVNLAYLRELDIENEERKKFEEYELEKEKKRRDYAMKVYQAEMVSWKENETERIFELERVSSELEELAKEKTAIEYEKSTYDEELTFFENAARLEAQKGSKLWETQAKSQVQKVKLTLDHSAAEEGLFRLKERLELLKVRFEDAQRIPLQALNPIDQLVLEKKSKEEVKKVQTELNQVLTTIKAEERRTQGLSDADSRFVRFTVARLKEERRCQDELNELLEAHIPLNALVREMRDGLDEVVDPTERQMLEFQYTVRKEQLNALRNHIALCYDREDRWREAVNSIGYISSEVLDKTPEYLSENEKERVEEKLAYMKKEYEERAEECREQVKHAQAQQAEVEKVLNRLKEKYQVTVAISDKTSSQLQDTSIQLIHRLQKTIDEQIQDAMAFKAASEEEYQRLVDQHSEIRARLEAEAEKAKEEAERRGDWISSMKQELNENRHTNEQLVKSYVALEKRQAEVNASMRNRLKDLATKSNGIQMWNEALLARVEEMKDILELKKEEARELKQQHKEEERKLRYEIWRHRITAQTILINVDDLILFFVQGIAKLAGSSAEYNDKLRENAAPEILSALCRCPRFEVQRLAAKSLGSLAWNGTIIPRLLGWNIKQDWNAWVELKTSQELLKLKEHDKQFDSPSDITDEQPNVQAEGMETHESDRLRIHGRTDWAIRARKVAETPNIVNQELLGQSDMILKTLVMLTRLDDWEVKRRATGSLSVASMHVKNTIAMGRCPGLILRLVELLDDDDGELQANALLVLANLAFNNPTNQQRIYQDGGIPKLVNLCKSQDVDVLYSTTAALANLCSKNQTNSIEVGHVGGIYILADLCHSERIVDILEPERREQIQANASECLVNIMEVNDEANIEIIHERGVDPFVSMCTSNNLIVRRHAALTLGNLAQNDGIRKTIGQSGGIDGLITLAVRVDYESRVNATWALSNLTWNRENQDRAGLFLKHIMVLCLDSGQTGWLQVQENALSVLANMLFYNQENRSRINRGPGWLQNILDLCNSESLELQLLEHATRALSALSYCNSSAKMLGNIGALPILVRLSRIQSDVVQLNMVHAMVNLCVHDENKRALLDSGGTARLVELSGGSDNREIRETSAKALEMLADLPSVEELQTRKQAIGMEGMLRICTTETSDDMTSMAAEAIAEETWKHPAQTPQRINLKGIDALLQICTKRTSKKTLLPALWALRNLMHRNKRHQDHVARLGGIESFLTLCRRYRSDQELLEAVLAAIINAVMGHESNSRRILCTGLDLLIDIAEDNGAKAGARSMNAQLAADALQLIGPHNWILCAHCGSKEHGGSRCSQCGRAIVFVMPTTVSH